MPRQARQLTEKSNTRVLECHLHRDPKLLGFVCEIENGDMLEYDEPGPRWLLLTEQEEPRRDVSGDFGRWSKPWWHRPLADVWRAVPATSRAARDTLAGSQCHLHCFRGGCSTAEGAKR